MCLASCHRAQERPRTRSWSSRAPAPTFSKAAIPAVLKARVGSVSMPSDAPPPMNAVPQPAHPTDLPSLLEVTGLNVSFGATRALSDVDLVVGAGELVAVAGEPGAGKTTLVR